MKTDKIRFLLIAFMLSLFLWSCNEEKIDPDKYVMSVVLQASRVSDQIKIQWYSPLILYNRALNYYNPNAVVADRYEIYLSENDTTNFKFLDEISLHQNEYIYRENIPGKKYFFTIKNYAKGASPTFSNKIWVMGGVSPEIEIIVNGEENNSLQFNDISPDNTSLIYSIFDENKTQLISLDIGTNNKRVLTEGAEQASFATSGKFISFVSQFGITTSPQRTNVGMISLLDQEITQITSGANVIQFPDWSPDDLSLFYLNVDQDYSNPWQLVQYHLDDDNSTILISAEELMITNRPISAKNSTNKIHFTAYNNEETEGIYEYHLIHESIIEIEQTPWSEFAPALSPNENYVAFISDRSGREEIWVKDLESEKYYQLTADFDGYPQGKLAWSNDNNTIYFKGYYQETNGIFKVNVEP